MPERFTSAGNQVQAFNETGFVLADLTLCSGALSVIFVVGM